MKKVSNKLSTEIVGPPTIEGLIGGQLAYSIPDACAQVGVKRSTIYVEIKQGRLRVVKCGRRTLVLRADLDEWLNYLPVLK